MHKQHGFGVTGIIIALIVISAVSFAGWSVIKRDQGKESKLYETTQQTAEDGAEQKNTEELSEVTSTLEIVEWGVKIDVSGAPDPIYEIRDNVAWVSTESYENLPECQIVSEQQNTNPYSKDMYHYFQGIVKLEANDRPYGSYPDETRTIADIYEKNPMHIKKINNIYYQFTHGNASPCSVEFNNYEIILNAFDSLSEI